jgi:hypothetical protein
MGFVSFSFFSDGLAFGSELNVALAAYLRMSRNYWMWSEIMAFTLRTWVGVFRGVSGWPDFEGAVWGALPCLLALSVPDIFALWGFNSEVWIRNVKNERMDDYWYRIWRNIWSFLYPSTRPKSTYSFQITKYASRELASISVQEHI